MIARQSGRVWPGLRLRAPWRQAVRMTVAALLAFFCTKLSGLPEGYWAVITCLVIVQGSLGGTLDAGLARLYGTIAGALAGGVGAWVQSRLSVPRIEILVVVIAPLSLLGAANPKFRLGPVTASLILLAIPSHGASFQVALNRIAEIALGSAIGVLTALLVLPGRGAGALHEHGAATLIALGELARAHLTGSEAEAEVLGRRVQAAVEHAQTACGEAMRERAVHLAGGPSPEPLMRTLRRLRTDVAMLGRAMPVSPVGSPTGEDRETLARTIRAWFDAAGKALQTRDAPPDLTPVTAASTIVPPDTALGFALLVLRRDLEDLGARVAERAALDRGASRLKT